MKGVKCLILRNSEVGVNHNGSVAQAKKLISGAKDTGASAAFQTFQLDELLATKPLHLAIKLEI